MKSLLIVFTCLIMSLTGKGQSPADFITLSLNDYISDIDRYVMGESKETIQRIIQDFNNDGLVDVMISGYYKGGWANSGGNWTLYYQNSPDSMEKCDEIIFMHPDATWYNQTETQLLSYHRMGCCEGRLSFIKISACQNTLVNSIEIREETGDEVEIKLDSILQRQTLFKKFEYEKWVLEK